MCKVRRESLSTARASHWGLKLFWSLEGVVRGGLWTVSILVLVLYLVTSFSQRGLREAAPAVQSFSHDSVPTAALSASLLGTDPRGSSSLVRYTLAHWAGNPGTWQFGDLDLQNSGCGEEEAVAFMLRVENAVPAATYTFGIRYDCACLDGGGYHFLSTYDRNRGVAPALHEDGPGTSVPDAALAVPDDPSIPFDNAENDRTFKLWGGSFASPAAGPLPADLCRPEQGQKAEKMYTVALTAHEETMYLLWSAHLTSPVD